MNSKQTVWVIGASSGLGLATAKAFALNGWQVIAGARSFCDNHHGLNLPKEDFYPLPLDVLDENSVAAFVKSALAIHSQVDVVCYAAGMFVLGPCEETRSEEYQQVMDTNFIGMTRIVNFATPLMRSQGHGKFFLFSSINGVVPTPFQNAYTASKHAIEGYGKCLSMETKPFGISVCIVQPGDHKGGSKAYRLLAKNAQSNSPYAKEYQSTVKTIFSDEAGGLSPDVLGKKVVACANKKHTPFYLRIASFDQRLACFIRIILPPKVFLSVLRGYYVKKASK